MQRARQTWFTVQTHFATNWRLWILAFALKIAPPTVIEYIIFLKIYLFLRQSTTYFIYIYCPLFEVHFGEQNKDGPGIKEGLETCFCDDTMQCTCGALSVRGDSNNGRDNKPKQKKYRDRDSVITGLPPYDKNSSKGELSCCHMRAISHCWCTYIQF